MDLKEMNEVNEQNDTSVTNQMEVINEENSDDVDQKQMIMAFIADTEERLKCKQMERELNSRDNIKYPEESFFVKLDSSIKKNSTFVKKLKIMTDAQKDSIFKDMNGLNLTKYISEVASAIVEAKLKMSDIGMALKICSALHQRYSDFSSQLMDAWQKNLPKKAGDPISAAKMRIDLRLLAELISSGIFTAKEGLPILGNLLIILTSADKETHTNINILLSFCRHCGDDYAGFMSRKMRQLANKYDLTIPQSDFLAADRQKGVKNLLKDYYKSLCNHVISDHKQLQNQEKQIRKTLQMKGEVPKERKEKFDAKQIDWQKLWASTQQFADILDEDLPDLPELQDLPEDADEINIMNFDVSNRFKSQPEFESGALWEDEDSRSFYQHLPDLKSLIPSILYKDSVKDVDAKVASTEAPIKDDSIKEEEPKEAKTDKEGTTGPSESEDNFEDEEIIVEEEIPGEEIDADVSVPAIIAADVDIEDSDDDSSKETSTRISNKILLDSFFNTILNCVNRDMIDKAAINFCTNLNTKNNRKKLVRALFTVPRTRLDLMPFYARFIAQISPIMPHVATDIVLLLKQDFRFLFRKKDQINIESKVKNVRFIGELVKFEVFSKTEALHCLKLLLTDFRHHHIEMTCNLLETCGRYLFRSKDSHIRSKLLLDQMMRKKALLPFDSRYITMIENAYYFANPPESQTITRVERPPMQEYIRKLLYHDLVKANVDKILRQMRKLNWDDPEVSSYAIRCFIAIWNVKFYNVRCVANLLAGFNSFQDWVSPQVIDGVLEDIRLGMEVNNPKYNQRRVSMVRYLGELYNYRLIDSSVVFKVLYSFVTYGIIYDHSIYCELDPPENLVRVRLICQILETCGQYFSSGLAKKKLDCFLFFFQRFFWFKKTNALYNEDNPFPFSMDYLYKDAILVVRPKFKFANSYESAVESVETLLKELTPTVQEVLPNFKIENDADLAQENQTESSTGLGPIAEVEEEQELESETQETSHQESDSEDEFEYPVEQQLEFHQKTTTDDGSGSESALDTDYASKLEPRNEAPKTIHCPEDDNFLKDFDKLMTESLISRSQELVRSNTDIVIPVNRVSGKKSVAFTDSAPEVTSDNDVPTINFMIMTRTKGNKPVLKNVDVPFDSELVQSLKAREEVERAEKEAVKKLILDINERREMEDRDAEFEKGTTSPTVINLNRDHRRKYQHPKGVPDADVIFGNRKR